MYMSLLIDIVQLYLTMIDVQDSSISHPGLDATHHQIRSCIVETGVVHTVPQQCCLHVSVRHNMGRIVNFPQLCVHVGSSNKNRFYMYLLSKTNKTKARHFNTIITHTNSYICTDKLYPLMSGSIPNTLSLSKLENMNYALYESGYVFLESSRMELVS